MLSNQKSPEVEARGYAVDVLNAQQQAHCTARSGAGEVICLVSRLRLQTGRLRSAGEGVAQVSDYAAVSSAVRPLTSAVAPNDGGAGSFPVVSVVSHGHQKRRYRHC